MEQFIADLTKEFTLNAEAVAFATKMFETNIVFARQMFDGKDEQQAFEVAVRIVRSFYEDDKEQCPLCGELEELHDWNKTEAWTGEPEFREKMGVSRCCCDCRHGLKDRKCEDCGMTYNPRREDTFMTCGACYDAAHPKCDECECRECECE